MNILKIVLFFIFYKKSISISILFLILMAFIACKKEDKKKAFIQQEINAAIDAYKMRRYKECSNAAYEKANMYADSIIRVKYTATDSLAFLGKPVKPERIKIKSPLDTTPVQPILPKK
jgi:ABC-type transporter MlaC component